MLREGVVSINGDPGAVGADVVDDAMRSIGFAISEASGFEDCLTIALTRFLTASRHGQRMALGGRGDLFNPLIDDTV